MGFRISLFFVVDGDVLTAMSLLLAATLRHHHPGPDVELVAYVTPRTLPDLPPHARALYDRCGVRVAPLDVPDGVWAKPYPHGNKLFACACPRDSDASVFLDTDMACIAPLNLAAMDLPARICAVPEGIPSWGKVNDRWERAYAHVGLHLPEDRVTLTRGRGIEYYPYFNAGFVAFPEREIADGKRFGQLWRDLAIDFDHNCAVGQKRPWLDQITLPLTIKRHGLDYQALPDSFNFSLSNRKRLGRTRKSAILHYHRGRYLVPTPQYPEIVAILAAALDDPARDLHRVLAGIGVPAEAWPSLSPAA